MAEKDALVINQSDLLAKLEEAKGKSDGDLARVIELLLLENHVVSLEPSTGFRRGNDMDFSDFPRFLKVDDAEEPTKEER